MKPDWRSTIYINWLQLLLDVSTTIDKSADKDESFYIELFDPKNGIQLGPHFKTVITIINDEGKMKV